jgi:hypothetical protein
MPSLIWPKPCPTQGVSTTIWPLRAVFKGGLAETLRLCFLGELGNYFSHSHENQFKKLPSKLPPQSQLGTDGEGPANVGPVTVARPVAAVQSFIGWSWPARWAKRSGGRSADRRASSAPPLRRPGVDFTNKFGTVNYGQNWIRVNITIIIFLSLLLLWHCTAFFRTFWIIFVFKVLMRHLVQI